MGKHKLEPYGDQDYLLSRHKCTICGKEIFNSDLEINGILEGCIDTKTVEAKTIHHEDILIPYDRYEDHGYAKVIVKGEERDLLKVIYYLDNEVVHVAYRYPVPF